MIRSQILRMRILKEAWEKANKGAHFGVAIPCRDDDTLTQVQNALYRIDPEIVWVDRRHSARSTRRVIHLMEHLYTSGSTYQVDLAKNELKQGRSFYIIVRKLEKLMYWKGGGGELPTLLHDVVIASDVWRPARND